jgi:hypothetical protein
MAGVVYDEEFFDQHFIESSSSARYMLEELYRISCPKSVADFGCGIGAWLAAAGSLGSEQLFGFDGPWVNQSRLADPRIAFSAVDFSGEISLPGRFDLALSVEVAEHLPEARSDWFVDTLCRASDVIVFGAAVPGQGGLDHINEQWPSYWVQKFRVRGYLPIDLFRSKVWNDEKIAWYYRQNTFLYIKNGSVLSALIDLPIMTEDAMIDVVHPTLFKVRQRQRDQFWASLNKPNISDFANVATNFLKTKVKRVIGRE